MAKKSRAKITTKNPPDWERAIKELTLAYKRFNGAPAKKLQWLVNFSELDLEGLSEGHLANLRWEVVAFGLGLKPEQFKNYLDYALDLSTLTIPPSDPDKSTEEHIRFLETVRTEAQKGAGLRLVKDFQNMLKEIFDVLFSGAQWKVTRPAQEETIALTHIQAQKGVLWADNPPAYSAEELLLLQIIDLIKNEKQRLIICQNPKCAKRFVAAKKGRAFFHSPKCSAYVRVNKARGKM